MITVEWDTPEHNAVRLDYSDPVLSWDEYHEAVRQSYNMVRSKRGTVHLIHNPGTTRMPQGNPLLHITKVLRELPENAGLTLMIVDDMMARRVIEMLLRLITGHNAKFVASLDEARETIKNAAKADV